MGVIVERQEPAPLPPIDSVAVQSAYVDTMHVGVRADGRHFLIFTDEVPRGHIGVSREDLREFAQRLLEMVDTF